MLKNNNNLSTNWTKIDTIVETTTIPTIFRQKATIIKFTNLLRNKNRRKYVEVVSYFDRDDMNSCSIKEERK